MAREIRFRTEGDLLVLQLQELTDSDEWGRRTRATWRDAKVEDLLSLRNSFTVADDFGQLREEVKALAQFVYTRPDAP